ncbi:RICIN domain-containing protein [Hymenobacter psychrotolerans]|uniref:WD40-like Beta Propeller Repeat n=1 Tax=Hymenobacter psychrotolerans DSM 18569 TaxID=1121959 RepID=A0A1M7GKK1_9BACT|nr:RICIN domain-containing protein [Hymenobacter psychrotolerans]SHM16741.1 WD40-like Beta Propeller Repeat [Hymenobacter psychrotolerans DSM 18569]
MILSLFRSLLFAVVFSCLIAGPLQAQYTSTAPEENAWYGIVARSSGRSLDVSKASTEAGAAAVQWEFTHPASQQWRFVRITPGGEYYRIEARHSGKCLTVDKPDENAPLVQRPWSGSFYQQWKLVPSGPIGSVQLVVRGNEKCAAIANSDKFNGTPVVMQRPQNRASQQWRLFQLRLNIDPSQPGYGTPEPLASLNSNGNELHPVLAPDGSALYFSRTRFAGNTEGNTESGDVWVSTSADQGRSWGPPTRLDALNTQQNNGVMAVVGAQGNTLLVRGTYERDGSFRDESASEVPRILPKGTRPAPLEIANYYSAGPATTFFMTADEKVLLLSLERGDSEGSNDLYVSQRAADGIWGEPRSLGNGINSPGFEFAPWLTPDGKTLYFSSLGHAGYGGSDIFVSTRLDDSWLRWSTPRNLGPSINGPGFDAYFSLTPDGKQAYYASARTPNAPADLYRTAAGVPPVVAPADSVPPVAVVANPAVDPRTLLTGVVRNAKTRELLAAEIRAIRLGNDIAFNATARSVAGSGAFQATLPAGRYRLVATAPGFLTATDTVSMTGSRSVELLLVPAAVGSSLELPTLIFAQGKFTLLPASYAELNRLARTLADNPKVNIRLEGHTDNQGNADLNQKLSEDRVGEVRRYLITRGVAEQRISVVGYGGTRPRASNDKEETRRLNRRVEFTIVK